jgi:hypothetical protein
LKYRAPSGRPSGYRACGGAGDLFGGAALVLQQGGQAYGLFENLGLQAHGCSPKELNSNARISFILYLPVKKWAMAWYKWGLLFMKM